MGLTIDSRPENVSLVSTITNNVCAQIPLTPQEAYAIELCVTEAVVNAIKHACQNDPNQKVDGKLSVNPKRIRIRVIDTERPMNPDQVANIPVTIKSYQQETIASVPCFGRGLMIIQNQMDAVSYQTNKGCNILTMIKHLTPSEEEAL